VPTRQIGSCNVDQNNSNIVIISVIGRDISIDRPLIVHAAHEQYCSEMHGIGDQYAWLRGALIDCGAKTMYSVTYL
jgi:hypothetical protein